MTHRLGLVPSLGWLVLPLLLAAAGACGSASPTSPDGGANDSGGQLDAGGADAGSRARVFITSTLYPGDLGNAGTGTSGLERADQLCNQVAAAGGLAGTFKAWLSDSTTNAVDRLSAPAGGWYTAGPTPGQVFQDKAQLATFPTTVILDENGRSLAAASPWTGTLRTGQRATSGPSAGSTGNCHDWTNASTDFAATGGSAGGAGAWSQANYTQCLNMEPLICFQQ